MVDRQKIEAILTRRFPGSAPHVVAAAANAIMGIEDEWEEIIDADHYLGCRSAASCREACDLARELDDCLEFRLFRRRQSAGDGIPATPEVASPMPISSTPTVSIVPIRRSTGGSRKSVARSDTIGNRVQRSSASRAISIGRV